jgi:hypothetical protein
VASKEVYKEKLRTYKDTIGSAKNKSWRNFCTSTNEKYAASDLSRAIKRAGNNKGRTWIAGVCSEEEHTKELLLQHFPGIKMGNVTDASAAGVQGCRGEVQKYLNAELVKEVMTSFGPHKSVGLDKVKPIMLQKLPMNVYKFIKRLYNVVCWWRTTATRSATADGRNVRTLGIP